jgi:uncharacterized protein YgiM (DUF1202 family)
MNHKIFIIGFVCCLLLTSCAAPTAQPAATSVPPTIQESPTETQIPSDTQEPTLTPEVTEEIIQNNSIQAFPGKVAVEVINLRTGPGTAHDVLGKYAKDAPVSVLGKALGDGWLLVETPAGQWGWMIAEFVTMDTPISTLPVIAVTYNVMVHGRVTNADGTPVNSITIAVYQQTVSGELRSDDATDENGEFYVFMPNGSQGRFSVAVVGVGCDSSIVDSECKYAGKFDANGIAEITLPSSESIDFIYRQ